MMDMAGSMHGWMWWGVAFMVVFWGALIGFGVWAVRRFTNRPHEDVLAILQVRFARGEIGAEEYEKSRRILEGR